MAATKSKDVDSGELNTSRSQVDFTQVVYQAILDFKETQGEVRARLDEVSRRLEKVETKATATEKKLDRLIWIGSSVVILFSICGPLILDFLRTWIAK